MEGGALTLVRFVDRQSGRVTIVQPDEHARRRHEWLIGASAHAAKCFYAGERVATLVFDRRGNRVWRQAKSLLDSEHARLALGEVAVPYGVCTEPSNVKAGGGACPYRFRCVGCGRFRTDFSYLPDLHAYLDDLLRNRKRLLAAADIDDWVLSQAMPSEEEIGRIRSLIASVSAGLDHLEAAERAGVNQAIEVIRAHRAVALAMPRLRRVPVDPGPRSQPRA